MPHCSEHHRALREEGVRVTPQRLIILEVVQNCQCHLSAEEIHREVQARFPHVDISTVYRTLEMFRRLGVVQQADLGEGQKRYEWGGEPEHSHMLCAECGGVFHFDDEWLADLKASLATRHGFQPIAARLTVFGRCRACQDQTSHQSDS